MVDQKLDQLIWFPQKQNPRRTEAEMAVEAGVSIGTIKRAKSKILEERGEVSTQADLTTQTEVAEGAWNGDASWTTCRCRLRYRQGAIFGDPRVWVGRIDKCREVSLARTVAG